MFTDGNILEQFISKLLDELGFTEISEETRNQYLVQFEAELERRIGVAVLATLTPELAETFTSLLESSSQDMSEVSTWLTEHVPNYETTVRDTLDQFATELKTAAQV